jgi:hypothetical protein
VQASSGQPMARETNDEEASWAADIDHKLRVWSRMRDISRVRSYSPELRDRQGDPSDVSFNRLNPSLFQNERVSVQCYTLQFPQSSRSSSSP